MDVNQLGSNIGQQLWLISVTVLLDFCNYYHHCCQEKLCPLHHPTALRLVRVKGHFRIEKAAM